MIAADNDKLQAAQCLLEKGADPSLEDNNAWNLLHHASMRGSPVMIELMLSHVPSIDSRNNEGVTALMIAAANDNLQAVGYLLEKGADPSLEDNQGMDLVDHASYSDNHVVTKIAVTLLLLAQNEEHDCD